MQGIYAKKLVMTRIFDEEGKAIPVTVVEIQENVVTQVKNQEKDGYQAIQVGYGQKKRLNKSENGHLAKSKAKSAKLFEIKTEKEYQLGESLSFEFIEPGKLVNVTGISKGKGFAGTVKRHHFELGPKTHGSDNYRRPGSIGSTFPQRVVKGRRMAGHLGNKRSTTQNIKVIKVDSEKKLVYLGGAVPGANKSNVLIWSNNES